MPGPAASRTPCECLRRPRAGLPLSPSQRAAACLPLGRSVGPEYTPAPEIAGAKSLASRGTVTELVMSSADSAIFPGVDRKDPIEGKQEELCEYIE